jgi:hypothetical protein
MAKLPDANEPLLLADGTVIVPSVASTFTRTAIPSNSQAQRLVSNTHRKLVELPALPKQINSYAAILVYTASGLSDAEISVATKFTIAQITLLRSQPAYAQLEQFIIETVKQEAAGEVKSILLNGEVKAATKVVELIDSIDDKVALAASKDLLDRGGHKAAEKLDIRADMMNTFRIEVVDKRNAVPTIDMEID